MITVGIDEVGRGCWAGPMVVGAVILSKSIAGLKDSKKLSKKRREELDKVIRSEATSFGLGWVSPREIDKLGLTEAEKLAIERALDQIEAYYDEIIIDGNINYLSDNPDARAVVNADDSVLAVSAASIIAKVARDSFMLEQSEVYPGYGFENNVGYGTAKHKLGLASHGVCRLHRHSFKPIKAML